MKTGTYVELDGIRYIFLGWTDSKMRWAVFADMHGNKHTRYFPNPKNQQP